MKRESTSSQHVDRSILRDAFMTLRISMLLSSYNSQTPFFPLRKQSHTKNSTKLFNLKRNSGFNLKVKNSKRRSSFKKREIKRRKKRTHLKSLNKRQVKE
jgi:hypothetical protein